MDQPLPTSSRGQGACEPGNAADAVLAFADRRRRWIFAAVAVLYLAAFNGAWRVSPDSALYASLGRSLAEGDGFSYHGEAHNWAEPGLPLAIAASFRIAGPDHFEPVLAFILTCALAGLALTYWLLTLHADRPTAVVVTTMLALCETYLRYAYHVFTDSPFVIGALAFLVGYERLELDVRRHRWASWAMIAGGVLWMAAFREVVLTFVGATGLAVAWHLWRGRDRWRHALIGATVLASLFAFRTFDPRRSGAVQADHRESKLRSMLTERLGFVAKRAATEAVPMLLNETTTEAVIGNEIWADAPVAVAILVAGVCLAWRRPLWGVLVAATVAQMVFWLPRERYFLPVLPLLFYALWLACVASLRLRPRPLGLALFRLAFVALTVPNLVQCVLFVRQQHREPLREGVNGPEFVVMRAFAAKLARQTAPADTVLTAMHDRELSYFARRKVVAPPSAQRLPPTPAQREAFVESLRASPRVFVVLPDDRQRRVGEVVEELGMKVGPPFAQEPRPSGSRGDGPWSLHALTPTGGPATRAVK